MRRIVKTASRPELASQSGEPSLGSIGRTLWRKRNSIILPTLVMTSLAVIAVNLLTPRYQAESRVLVEGRENIFLRPEAEKAMDRSTLDQETLTSQVQLVLSRDLARDVIAQLNLAELPEFNAALRDSSPLDLLRTIGLLRDPLSMSLEERVLAAYYERLSAYAVDKSRVIVIDFQSQNSDLAARAANVVAEKYLGLQQLAKQDQARAASQWLSGEIEKLRQRVADAEAKVEEFRSGANIFIGANNTTLSNQQLTELNTQLSAARVAKDDAETKARLIREQLRAGRVIEFSDVSNSDLIRRLSEQRVTLRAQLAEQSATLLPQHPRIKELRAQIADLDQQIRNEGDRLARLLESDAKVADARATSLAERLDQLKRQATLTGEQDVRLRALEREAKAQRDLLESYLAKFREATARDSIAAAPPDARIISRASASNVPYFPKKMPIILITALATLCLSAAFVVTGALLEANPYREPSRIDDEPVVVDEPQVVEKTRVVEKTQVTEKLRVAEKPEIVEPPQTLVAPVAPPKVEPPTVPAPDLVPPESEIKLSASEPATPVAPVSMPAEPASSPVVEPSLTTVPAAPVAMTFDEVAAALRQAGETDRCRVAVVGIARKVGTTLTALALARDLARNARVVLVDLAFASPNLDVISDQPGAAGVSDLVRGEASFGDIISRDWDSPVHVVTAGRMDFDDSEVLASPMLAAALDALSQSYDYLIVDVGSQSDVDVSAVARLTPCAVMVMGETSEDAGARMRDQLLTAGFTDVAMMSGWPPALDHLAPSAAVA